MRYTAIPCLESATLRRHVEITKDGPGEEMFSKEDGQPVPRGTSISLHAVNRLYHSVYKDCLMNILAEGAREPVSIKYESHHVSRNAST